MLQKHLEMKSKQETEYGFTLIELLVVIIIIGILAAIAVPAFLNQRQRANDVAVKNDLRNVGLYLETTLIDYPNVSQIFSQSGTDVGPSPGWASNSISFLFDHPQPSIPRVRTEPIPLSDGVRVRVVPLAYPSESASSVTVYSSAKAFSLQGYHINGKQYGQQSDSLHWESQKGGFTNREYRTN